MSRFRIAGLALLVTSLFVGSANAALLPLREDQDAPEKQIINVVFSNYLKEKVGGSIESGVIDLDGDGVAEVFARFVHTSSCDATLNKCRTVVLKHGTNKWKIIFDRHATSQIDVRDGVKRIPRPIEIDETVWEWSYDSYMPTAEGIGTSIAMAAVPDNALPSYASAFGGGSIKLAEAKRLKISYANTGISKNNDVIILKIDGGTACGEVAGCPVRALMNKDGKWVPALSASTAGNIYVAKTERGGYRDIVVPTDRGYSIYGWNGTTYVVADRIERVKE